MNRPEINHTQTPGGRDGVKERNRVNIQKKDLWQPSWFWTFLLDVPSACEPACGVLMSSPQEHIRLFTILINVTVYSCKMTKSRAHTQTRIKYLYIFIPESISPSQRGLCLTGEMGCSDSLMRYCRAWKTWDRGGMRYGSASIRQGNLKKGASQKWKKIYIYIFMQCNDEGRATFRTCLTPEKKKRSILIVVDDVVIPRQMTILKGFNWLLTKFHVFDWPPDVGFAFPGEKFEI